MRGVNPGEKGKGFAPEPLTTDDLPRYEAAALRPAPQTESATDEPRYATAESPNPLVRELIDRASNAWRDGDFALQGLLYHAADAIHAAPSRTPDDAPSEDTWRLDFLEARQRVEATDANGWGFLWRSELKRTSLRKRIDDARAEFAARATSPAPERT